MSTDLAPLPDDAPIVLHAFVAEALDAGCSVGVLHLESPVFADDQADDLEDFPGHGRDLPEVFW
jgi:hypothetical protein